MDAAKVTQVVGSMIVRNSLAIPDDRAARVAFDSYVLAVAAGRPAKDLTEGQIRALQGCDRRGYDRLPKEVSDALGFAEGKTYRDAVNLCEKSTHRTEEERVKAETKTSNPSLERRQADRRRSERRQRGVAALVRAVRKRLKHRS